ncbi:AraC-type DNA-binding protein [Catalinimonas alkaloidigena]|uniref:AraC-type DNA-binding protein n=1 Tax=Catalinimonas alkaloidigena TaxID=1075417 RepID=A0A1G9IQN8_9BACT|nr:AraC family transcriptional regulator [Catalinimonas alkaloidigena]SDL27174.1 AraC-type DNA-binding protein [Catalinimonas alkaloidigena]
MPPGASLQEWNEELTLPGQFQVVAASAQKTYRIETTGTGRLSCVQLAFGEVVISQAQVQLPQPALLQRSSVGESVEMIFLLSGDSTETSENPASAPLWGAQHNLYYDVGGAQQIELVPDEGRYEVTVIHLPKPYFLRLLREEASDLAFLASFQDGQPGFLCAEHLAMTPQVRWVLHELQHYAGQGVLKRLFLEAKVLELLTLQLAQMAQRWDESATSPETEFRPLQEARKILDDHWQRPPTIVQLAKRVGVNEFRLKKGFKETFGTTIFGYVSDLKMTHAKRMLLHEGRTVTETATAVGYKNPQHFTAAFKRCYGILPSELKQ